MIVYQNYSDPHVATIYKMYCYILVTLCKSLLSNENLPNANYSINTKTAKSYSLLNYWLRHVAMIYKRKLEVVHLSQRICSGFSGCVWVFPSKIIIIIILSFHMKKQKIPKP